MFLRIIYDTPTIRMEIQKGILQPQLSNSSAERDVLVTRITIRDINKPAVAVVSKPKRAMVMRQADILPNGLVEIQSEEDIEKYLESLRTKLKSLIALENVDVLKLS